MTSVVFDGIVFALQRRGGIGRYFRELCARHVVNHPASRLVLYGATDEVEGVPASLIEMRRPRLGERYRRCAVGPGSVFHSSYYRLPSGKMPVVTTVHDFIYEKFRRGPARAVHTAQKGAAIRGADAVICVSETTKGDLMALYPRVPEARIKVVPNGVSDVFLSSRARKPGDAPYAMFVGSRVTDYKNFSVAVAAVREVPELALVAVGAPPSESEAKLASELGGRLRFASVDDEGLRGLYEGAVCLIYPSLYEGFGLPILEAMACRCPVVCLEAPGVRETAGAEAHFVGENRAGAFVEVIKAVLRGPGDSARYEAGAARARQHSWARSYELTNAVYASLARA
jgi:mannosyltransferase